MRTTAVAVLAAAGLAGCAAMRGDRESEIPIKERWAVSQDASPECISAARRASRYCLDKTMNSDIYGVYTSECTKAQWDHTRHCR